MILAAHKHEACRIEEHVRTFKRHQAELLGEAEVIADRKAELADFFRIINYDLFAGALVLGLTEAAAAYDVYIEHVHLAVLGNKLTLGVKQHAGVVWTMSLGSGF